MTRRLIAGRHPLDGSYGIWLSKPGIDAGATLAIDNFLLAPIAKNDMVLMSGVASAGVFVAFPYTLNGRPYVYYWPTNVTSADHYPFPVTLATSSGDMACTVTTSGMTFTDGSGLGLVFNYLVTSREF